MTFERRFGAPCNKAPSCLTEIMSQPHYPKGYLPCGWDFFERMIVKMADNYTKHDMSQILEAVFMERQATMLYEGVKEIEVKYSAFDLLKFFMETNYCKYNFSNIVYVLSRAALLNKPDKDTLMSIRLREGVTPGVLKNQAVLELLNVMRAYQLIDCDQNYFYYVTDEGRRVTNEAIIAKDQARG